MSEKKIDSKRIWDEYESGRRFKAALGELGLYEQNKRNERFYVGDQWHGAKCGGERPLVRHNVIKRIGDYKMAVIGASPVTVRYSLEGVPSGDAITNQVNAERERMVESMGMGQSFDSTAPGIVSDTLAMDILSDYFDTMAERVKLDDLKSQVLRDAYVGGTGFLYTYWDADVDTGMYADDAHTAPIRGDIAAETLDVENVYLGDPNTADIQKQPYILIAQRKSVKELRDIARKNRLKDDVIEAIKPDNDTGYMSGDRSSSEPNESKKATVITRLWKENENGKVTVKAVQAVRNVIIRREWDLGIRRYPLAMFRWEHRKGCAYGDSEVTYLIPNQIAINRMITASVWAVMMMGVPMTIVNGDVVDSPVTNDPGQVLRVFGSAEDVASAVRYVNPPNFSPQFDQNIQSLISNTLTQSGANEAALGDMRPDNMSAIVAVREAATTPMQPFQNRFYSFIEDVARIWAEFCVMKYGARSLKTTTSDGVWYMPFDGDRYIDRIVNAKVDVGAAGLWSESQSIATLGNLLQAQLINPIQYLERLPNGIIPRQQELIEEKKAEMQAMQPPLMGGGENITGSLPPEYLEQLTALPPEQQEQIINQAMGA